MITENKTYSGVWEFVENTDGTVKIVKYLGKDNDVTVPAFIDEKPVFEIGCCAFEENDMIRKVSISEGIHTIGSYAFSWCLELKTVSIPNSVRIIESDAFLNCDNLSDIKIPEGVLEISSNLFFRCKSLKEIIIPSSVLNIESGAFEECENLVQITMPDYLKSIGNDIFKGCTHLKSIVVPKGIKMIAHNAFDGCCSLSEIVLPDGIEQIAPCAFKGCSGLQNIVLPNSVRSIEYQAFEGCVCLENMTIPGSIEQTGSRFLKGCQNLTLTIIGREINLMQIFRNADCLPIYTPNISIDDLPSTKWKVCAVKGFLNRIACNKSISNDLMENYLSYIKTHQYAKQAVFDKMFENKLIFDFVFENKIIGIKDIDGLIEKSLQSQNNEVTPRLVQYKKDNFASNAPIIKKIRRNPSDKMTVADYKKIWNFKNNGEKSYEIISYKGKDINVVVPEKIGNFTVTEIGKEVFSCNQQGIQNSETRRKINSIILPDTIKKIGQLAFSYCTIKEIVIPDSVETMFDLSFLCCEQLEKVKLSNKILWISSYMFAECKSLQEIEIPNHVTRIHAHAFENCIRLQKIVIASQIQTIEASAFKGCSELKEIHLCDWNSWCKKEIFFQPTARISVLDYDLYLNGNLLTEVEIPKDIERVNNYAFYGCRSIKTVRIPENIVNIGEKAFMNCKGLMDVVILNKKAIIADDAFEGCDHVHIIAEKGSTAIQFAQNNHIPFQILT